MSQPAVGTIFLAGTFHRCSAGSLAVVDSASDRTAVVEDRSEVLDHLESVLQAASKGIRLDGFGSMVPAHCRADVVDVVDGLRERGFLIGSDGVAKRALRASTYATETREYRESVVYGMSRWRPPSVDEPIASAPRRLQSDRGRSTRLDLGRRPFERLDPMQVVEVLTLAYGTLDGGGKPVSSAGALWPLTLLVWVQREDSQECDLLWFDDHSLAIRPARCTEPVDSVSSWFLQPDYIRDLLGSGAWLVFVGADFSRSAPKYANRAAFFAAVEAGAVAQEICRSAPAFGISTRLIGGFDPSNPPKTSSADIEFLLAVVISRGSD